MDITIHTYREDEVKGNAVIDVVHTDKVEEHVKANTIFIEEDFHL